MSFDRRGCGLLRRGHVPTCPLAETNRHNQNECHALYIYINVCMCVLVYIIPYLYIACGATFLTQSTHDVISYQSFLCQLFVTWFIKSECVSYLSQWIISQLIQLIIEMNVFIWCFYWILLKSILESSRNNSIHMKPSAIMCVLYISVWAGTS